MTNQDNMSLPEASNPIIIDPEISYLAEAQDTDLKIAIMNVFKDL